MKILQFFTGFMFLLTAVSMSLTGTYVHGDFVPISGDGGRGIIAEDANISETLNNIFVYAIGAAALLAVLMIAIGGLQYMGTDAWSTKEEAKSRILSAVLGLLIILASVLILTIINPELLNLDILRRVN